MFGAVLLVCHMLLLDQDVVQTYSKCKDLCWSSDLGPLVTLVNGVSDSRTPYLQLLLDHRILKTSSIGTLLGCSLRSDQLLVSQLETTDLPGQGQ